MRPVLGKSAFPSYFICKLVTLPGSRGPGNLLAKLKLVLSKLTTNSTFSFKGFLKSMPTGLAPIGHLIGPYGYGADDLPYKRQLYSKPSAQVSLRMPLESPMVNGSYFMLI